VAQIQSASRPSPTVASHQLGRTGLHEHHGQRRQDSTSFDPCAMERPTCRTFEASTVTLGEDASCRDCGTVTGVVRSRTSRVHVASCCTIRCRLSPLDNEL
jgi:hypothetical protein